MNTLSDIECHIDNSRAIASGRYARVGKTNQRVLSATCGKTWVIGRYNLAQNPVYRPGLSQSAAPKRQPGIPTKQSVCPSGIAFEQS